ncbi:MAG TPA: Yip1 family protein, partial [Anaerolineales bacterium]
GFQKIAELQRSVWQAPMLLLSLTTFLSIVVGGYFKARAAMMGTAPLPMNFQYWTPEMQQNYYQAQQAMQGPVFVYIIPLVGGLVSLWLGWLILAGILHLISTLFGGRGSLGGAFNVAGFALLPFAVRDVLRLIFIIITRQGITSPGLSGFASGAGFAAQLLSHLDIFLIWHILLLIIGLAAADELPHRKAALSAVSSVVLIMLAQAGLGALGANLGGMAVQRPFF